MMHTHTVHVHACIVYIYTLCMFILKGLCVCVFSQGGLFTGKGRARESSSNSVGPGYQHDAIRCSAECQCCREDEADADEQAHGNKAKETISFLKKKVTFYLSLWALPSPIKFHLCRNSCLDFSTFCSICCLDFKLLKNAKTLVDFMTTLETSLKLLQHTC